MRGMMVTPSHRVRRRRRRSNGTRRLRTFFVAVVAIASIVAGAWVLQRATTESRPPVVSDAEPANNGPIDGTVPAIADRPIYKHSVIPGGVRDQRELAGAIERDPVVAQHYRDLDPATMQRETLRADQFAFVSYRMGDRIYWTKQKVRISAGETILTNGDTAIRTRCGNCISLEPMLPTADDEPDPAELDALLGDDPLLPSRDLIIAMSVGGASADEADPVGHESSGLILFPLAGSLSGGGSETPGTIVPPDDFPGDAVLVGDDPFASFPSPLISTLFPGAPPFGPPPSITSFDPSFTDFSDPLDDFPDPDQYSPTTDINPTPVPEPGTFVLLGSAMAGLLARRWRAAKHR
jgi:hypothetical protein